MSSFSFSNWSSQNVQLLDNLANNLLPVQTLMKAVCYLLGLMFIFKALYCLKMYGESRSMTSSSTHVKEPIIYIFVGAAILFLPTSLKIMLSSTFGSPNILAYSGTPQQQSGFGKAGWAVTTIIQTIGFIAFIRGWLMVAKSAGQGQQAGSMGKGFMHVLGGILAINIVSTIQIVNNTLYG